MDYAQMAQVIREMATNSVMILDEGDREFIVGLSLVLEMGEAVPASYAERVMRIHERYLQDQYR